MLQEAEARYKEIAGQLCIVSCSRKFWISGGNGLFVMRMEPGGDGTDKLVQAAVPCCTFRGDRPLVRFALKPWLCSVVLLHLWSRPSNSTHSTEKSEQRSKHASERYSLRLP